MDAMLERLHELEMQSPRGPRGTGTGPRGARGVAGEAAGAPGRPADTRSRGCSLRAEREREATEVNRAAGRARGNSTKVEGLLAEIARLESTVQGTRAVRGGGMTGPITGRRTSRSLASAIPCVPTMGRIISSASRNTSTASSGNLSSRAQAWCPSKVAVLVSVNIADELFKQSEEARRREQEALARIDGIVALLRREDVAG